MKKIIPIMALFLAALVTMPSHAHSTPTIAWASDFDPISSRDVNRLLKIAADQWSISVGAAHQAYHAGTLTLTAYPEEGEGVYMIAYDGFCILVVLEDKL